MAGLIRRSSFIVSVLSSFVLNGCYLFGIVHTSHNRVPTGLNVTDAWTGRYCQTHIRCPNQKEIGRFRVEHAEKIDMYFGWHRELDEKRKSELRSLHPKIGMTKEEVALFLIGPFEKIRDPQIIATQAQQFWPELQGRADEAWIYKYWWSTYTYFFERDVLVDIHLDAPTSDVL